MSSINTFKVGQAVVVDERHNGEIIEDMMGDVFRVEVDCDKEKHEFWTVKSSRMELMESGGNTTTHAIPDYKVVRAMHVYGGGFVKALAEAFDRADGENFYKLKAAFPEYWEQYTRMAEYLK